MDDESSSFFDLPPLQYEQYDGSRILVATTSFFAVLVLAPAGLLSLLMMVWAAATFVLSLTEDAPQVLAVRLFLRGWFLGSLWFSL